MRRSVSYQAFCLLLVCLLGAAWPALAEQAKQSKNNAGQPKQQQAQHKMSPAQAAAQATARHGGKVLKVSPKGKGYRVKLLTDNGKVRNVMIKD